MKFMLMMNAPAGGGDWGVMSWPVEDLKRHVEYMKTLVGTLDQDGVLVTAEGLAPPNQAKLVRAGDSGAPVTDGPFAETKEFLAGYWIIDVDSAEDAYRYAAKASLAPGKGGKPMHMAIEVRQVMSAPPV